MFYIISRTGNIMVKTCSTILFKFLIPFNRILTVFDFSLISSGVDPENNDIITSLHISAIVNDAARRDAAIFHLPRGRAVPPLSAWQNIKGRIANVVYSPDTDNLRFLAFNGACTAKVIKEMPLSALPIIVNAIQFHLFRGLLNAKSGAPDIAIVVRYHSYRSAMNSRQISTISLKRWLHKPRRRQGHDGGS